MKQKAQTNQVEISGAGFGEASDDTIARRAWELAVADGRQQASRKDIEDAREELVRGSGQNREDELDLIDEQDRPGDGVPPTGSGTQSPRLELENEDSIALEEVEEGIAEADRDTRFRSNK